MNGPYPFAMGDIVRCRVGHYKTIRYNETTEVTSCFWGDTANEWIIRTRKGSYGYRASTFELVQQAGNRYRNPSDNSGQAPFLPDDHIVSITNKWSTMRKGRKAVVDSCEWSRTRRGWFIKIKHPKFGPSSYAASGFILDPEHYQSTTGREKKEDMHIVLDITEHKKLDPSSIHDPLINESTFVTQDASLATLKNIVNQMLAKEPERSYAIFSLTWIAEVEQPRPPVRWRDMK